MDKEIEDRLIIAGLEAYRHWLRNSETGPESLVRAIVVRVLAEFEVLKK